MRLSGKICHAIFFGLIMGMARVSPARAFTIENKSPHTARVIVTDVRFTVLGRFSIPPESIHEFVDEDRRKELFNIDATFDDPRDPTGLPTFFHQVKYKDKICMPLSLCEKKKKKRGFFDKLF